MCSLIINNLINKSCKHCPLSGNKVVWGYGNYKNRIVFIGEAPGAEEQKLGKPFVGRSGKLLTEMLDKSGINRNLVYITNIVKCRPKDNRTPTTEERKFCSTILNYELKIIKPDIIITLGSTAINSIFPKVKLSDFIGRKLKTKYYYVYPLYHPAYVLRNGITRESYLDLFFRLKEFLISIYHNLDVRYSYLFNYWLRSGVIV